MNFYFQFEIDADDDEDLVISSHSIGDCHNQLIAMINKSRSVTQVKVSHTSQGIQKSCKSHKSRSVTEMKWSGYIWQIYMLPARELWSAVH